MNIFLSVFTLLALNLNTNSIQLSMADETPDPRLISIESVQARGNACRNGTVNATLTPDNRALSLIFDNYVAELSNADGKPHDRQSCDIDIALVLPAGWEMALFRADYRGFANLDANTLGAHELIYSFPNARGPARRFSPPPYGRRHSFSAQVLRGPYQSDYLFTNTFQMNQIAWSGCSTKTQVLRISSSIMVRGLGHPSIRKQAMMTLDSIDANIKQDFGVTWRRCP